MTTILELPGEDLRDLWQSSGLTQKLFARRYGVSFEPLHSKISNATQRAIRDQAREYLKPSPYPVYDKPLETHAESCVVLPDTEFPFHNAEFINRVLDLANIWGVRHCNVAGDALHFDSISHWSPSWKAETENGMTEAQEATVLEVANSLKGAKRDKLLAVIEKDRDGGGDGVGAEVKEASNCLVRLGEQFDQVDYVIGNHDGRFLSALNSPLFADQLLKFLGLKEPKFRIAPYYYSILESGGRTFYIEHPRSSADSTAVRLADVHHVDILMAHSHKWSHQYDTSGQYHAIQMGCCVDERRLCYAAQRHSSSKAHKLGAVIVRDGWPWLLCEDTPWAQLARMC